MTTGERIRQLRIEHQMTQEELGARVGVQKAAIYKYENGLVVNLKRSILEKLAIVLDTTPTYLMGMEDSEQQANMQLTPQQSTLLAAFGQLNEEGQGQGGGVCRRPRPLRDVIKNVLRLVWTQRKHKK